VSGRVRARCSCSTGKAIRVAVSGGVTVDEDAFGGLFACCARFAGLVWPGKG
jgi:hypothetical protein